MINAGISTACFFEKLVTENTFETLKQLKCEHTEVFLTSFFEYETKFLEQLLLRKGNLRVHSVHALGTQFEPQLFVNSPRVRNDAELFFRKVCIAGSILGADYYTFHGPLYFKNKRYNVDVVSFGKRMKELTAIAREYGIKLAYENVHYSYFCEPKFWDGIIDYCPDLYGVLDIKHAALSGHDYQKYIDVMRDRIALVHVSDLDKGNSTCVPGNGRIDFEKLIKSLLKHDFDGAMIIELYANDYKDLLQLKDGMDYLSATLIKFRSAFSSLRREAQKEAAQEAEKDKDIMTEAILELAQEKKKSDPLPVVEPSPKEDKDDRD